MTKQYLLYEFKGIQILPVFGTVTAPWGWGGVIVAGRGELHLYFDYEFGERLALKMPFGIRAKGTVFSEQVRFTGTNTIKDTTMLQFKILKQLCCRYNF